MTEAPAAMPDVYPNVVTNHSRNDACFAEALRDPDGSCDAVEALHSLTVMPGEKRGEAHTELCGEL